MTVDASCLIAAQCRDNVLGRNTLEFLEVSVLMANHTDALAFSIFVEI